MPLAVLVALLTLPFVFTSSASALDLCEEPQCQPPPAEQNTPYEFHFRGEEGCLPYRFSYLNGTVPPGLRITEDGKLVGTPTETGDFEFWVALDDSVTCKTQQSQGHFFLHVMPDLAVTTSSLPLATPRVAYRAQLEFSNPEAGWPVIWDITQGTLPQGLSLSADGVLSGTPAGADVRTFTVRAREPFRRSGERQLTLTVADALQASSQARVGEVGLPYSGAVPAAGGVAPRTWSVATGTLPRGLSLNTTTGAISGVPRVAGSFALTFAVADTGGQHVTVPASIRIAARVAVATMHLHQPRARESYRARLQSSGGVGPKRWRIARGALPAGIKLDRTTRFLSGATRRSGVFPFTVQVTDRLGGQSAKRLRLTVVP